MPLYVAVIGIVIAMWFAAMYAPARDAQFTDVKAKAEAMNMVAYRYAVARYVYDNPTATGVISDAVITFPPGYLRDPNWTNVVSGGQLYVYSTAPVATGTRDGVYQRMGQSMFTGVATSGSFNSMNGATTGITLPGSIPDGSIVIVGK